MMKTKWVFGGGGWKGGAEKGVFTWTKKKIPSSNVLDS